MKGIKVIVTTLLINSLILLLGGCENKNNTEKVVIEGTVLSVVNESGAVKFTLNVVDSDTMEESQFICRWSSEDSNLIDELSKDLIYEQNLGQPELLRVYGENNKKNIIKVDDIEYLGESLGGIAIWDTEYNEPQSFIKNYKETGKGYLYIKTNDDENAEQLENENVEQEDGSDYSNTLKVSCYEAINSIPYETNITIQGKPINFFLDGYNNLYFKLMDNSDTVDVFWYNNNADQYIRIKDILTAAIDSNNEVIVNGIYKENPQQLGEYNLFAYDVFECYNNEENNIISNESNNLVDKITVENIKQYQPTGNFYMSVQTNIYGEPIGYQYEVDYTKVDGIDYYYLVYEYDGKESKLKMEDSPYRFSHAIRLKNVRIVGEIDGEESLYSEYLD